MEYLGNQISLGGVKVNLKDLLLVNSSFLRTFRSMNFFLGSLNYYSRFIKDFEIYESVLYELREVDFHEISRASDVSVSVLETDLDHDHDPKSDWKSDIDKIT